MDETHIKIYEQHYLTKCYGLNLWVHQHCAVQARWERVHLDNGFVSALKCWDALQHKRNYGRTAGRGPHKGPIIRGWWSEHAAHEQERQWRWNVINVTRGVEPWKLCSQLATMLCLDFSLFLYSLSFSSFRWDFSPAGFLWEYIPPIPWLSFSKLLSCFPLHHFVIPPAWVLLLFSHPSLTYDSWAQQLPGMCKSSK